MRPLALGVRHWHRGHGPVCDRAISVCLDEAAIQLRLGGTGMIDISVGGGQRLTRQPGHPYSLGMSLAGSAPARPCQWPWAFE